MPNSVRAHANQQIIPHLDRSGSLAEADRSFPGRDTDPAVPALASTDDLAIYGGPSVDDT